MRVISVLFIGVLALSVFAAAGASAVDESESPDAPAVTETEIPVDQQPAVLVSEAGEPAEDAAWTFRFLVPTLAVVSAIVLLLTGAGYAIRVRGRYRVVR